MKAIRIWSFFLACFCISMWCFDIDDTAAGFRQPKAQQAETEPKPLESTHGPTVFAAVTSRVWTNRAPEAGRPFGLCPVGEGDSEYRYLASGEYEHRWLPLTKGEPVIKASGRWNLQRRFDKHWVVCLDTGERHTVTLLNNGAIDLDGRKYPARVLQAPLDPNAWEKMQAIRLQESVLQRNTILTSRVWHRANDVNLDRFPTTIEFRADYSYRAVSGSQRKYPTGSWYATEKSALAVGPRDPQGEGDYLKDYGAFLRIDIESDNRIIIENTPYVSKEDIGKRGMIRHFGGYGDPIRLELTYEMPIRRGIPCRFDLHCVSAPDMTLQRFSITKEYCHEPRNPDGTMAQMEETAAFDLKNSFVNEGESKSFSFDVTFPESGDHTFYLNAFIKGATQNWDEREAVMFHILE
ncbi:MAG: hypothetical protein JNL58_11450 [Planctomyces sp.]|nr:hypothetical protein [Planctomyces sp.]